MKTNKFQFDAMHIQKVKSVCCQEIVKHLAKGGRLGNQLFEHAATLAIAKATKKQACVIGRNVDLIDKYFTVDGVFLRNCANTTPSQSASETGYAFFSPLPKAERSLEIFGFFQSWKYFAGAEAEAEIMRAFTLKPKYLRYADEILGKGGEDSYYNVGIHMRWFEYDYLIDPPKEYYQSAMGYFRRTYGQKNKRVRFYLASSDIERSKKLGLFTDESVVILNNQEAIYDFAVLMSCEGMILSSGSFGWWAAWLGPHQRNGEVFYFSDVFDMNDSINKGHVQKEDYYPPNWKEIAPEDLSS
jgi:galactoside 2-L-fucosyltransferase 1/2